MRRLVNADGAIGAVRTSIQFGVLAIALLLAACGGDDDAPLPLTVTPTALRTSTATAIATASVTDSPRPTASATETATATHSSEPTGVATATATPPPTTSATPTVVLTATATPLPTDTSSPTPDIDPRETRLILQDLPGALLSISGRAHDDVYAVGADPGDGMGPMVMHWNGRSWSRLRTGATGDLWWISDKMVDGAFYMAGTGGLTLRFEPASGRFEQLPTPGDDVLFGVWVAPDRHSWAVGGDLANPVESGVVLVRDPIDELPPPSGAVTSHLGGPDWSVDSEAPKVLPGGLPILYKVWGVDEGDVWASGSQGVVLHFDGIRWISVETPGTQALFTIHGAGNDVVAVGGGVEGVILELESGRFVDRTPLGLPIMNGVSVAADGVAIAVGQGGNIARRTQQGWQPESTPLNPFHDFHAVWIDPQGGIWMVGGDLSIDLDSGVVAYAGPQAVSDEKTTDVPCPPSRASGGETTISYTEDIVPLFAASGCTNSTCHAGPLLSSEYDMGTWATTFGPGTQARQLRLCEVAPGSPEQSYLFEKITNPRFGSRMPNTLPPLSPAEIAVVETWIREGATDDSVPQDTPTPSPTAPPTNTPAGGNCASPGIICTVAGTGMSVFDGDGRAPLATSFYYPLDVVFQPDGRLIVNDWNNLRARRVDFDGIVRTIIGIGEEAEPRDGLPANETPLHHASDFAFDAQGRLLIAGNHVPYVYRVDLDDRVFIVAGNGEVGTTGDGGPAREARWVSPFGVLPDGDGGFWVSDVDGHTIRHVGADGIVERFAGDGSRGYSGDGGSAVAAQLDGPTRMARDGNGDLIFCDTDNHVLRRILSDGTIETFAGTGSPGYSGDGGAATAAQLWSPYDLAVAADGTIYVAESGSHVVRAIEIDGIIDTVAGTGIAAFAGDQGPANEARLRRPSGLTLGDDGSLWIADTLNHRIRRIAGIEPPREN